MAERIDPAELEIILKAMGIENVKEVVKGFEDLKTSAKGAVAPIDEAQQALDKLKDSSKLTGSELEMMSEQARAVQSATLAAEAALAKITRALDEEEAAATKAAEALSEAAGAGDGESGVGGFAGLAGGAIKAEKAMLSIATGHGVGRVGGMLETLTSAAGLASGTGMAIGAMAMAIEVMLPKIGEWIEKMDGAAAATKRAVEAIKDYNAEVKKEESAPSGPEEQAAEYIKLGLKGKNAQEVRQAVEASYTQSGLGLTGDEFAGLNKLNAAGMGINANRIQKLVTPDDKGKLPVASGQVEFLEQRRRLAVMQRTGETMEGLRRGSSAAIGEVSAIPGIPSEFRQLLGDVTPAALAASRSADIDLDAEEAERQGTKDLRLRAQGQASWERKEAEKKAKKDEQVWNHGVDVSNRIFEAQDREDETAQKKAAAEAKRRQHEAQRLVHQHARENTPEAMNRRQQQDDRNTMMGIVQANTHGFGAHDQQSITDQALRNVSMGADLATAVQAAVMATQQKIQQDFMRQMQRQQVWSESYYPG